MYHPLPAKPGTSTPAPLPAASLHLLDGAESIAQPTHNADAGPSRIPYPAATLPSTTACVICDSPPKYTCPKCSFRTCSLNCSKAHKTKFSCTGERNPTGYIPLKAVGQGTWADDYKWLEEGRRKVAKWGEELPKDLLHAGAQQAEPGRGGLRGRGGRGGHGARSRTSHADKRIFGLGKELERRGIRVEFMPEGMDRRKKNQSSWNMKTQTLHLTTQLSLHSELVDDGQAKLITHARILVSEAKPSSDPATLRSLLPPDLQPNDLVFLLPVPASRLIEGSSPLPGAQHYFPPLDPPTPILDALNGTVFVEFPTVTILPRSRWDELLQSGRARIVPKLDVQPVPPRIEQGVKRKREEATGTVQPTAKSQANGILVGLDDYASGSEEEEDGAAVTR